MMRLGAMDHHEMRESIVRSTSEIGARIRAAREAAGMTQEELARRTKSGGQGNVARWEAGRITPGIHNLRALCGELRVSADWLLFGEGEAWRT